ncbi:regulatory protein RecX [Psychromonas aquimarina]|uniref:regulatory protein RecX n=1 Tax=Psychromonas aquimarina TaxID=444919 RepID=UPI00041384BF|nr:regulatory protein RecX [Psychromonas aquimarina]
MSFNKPIKPAKDIDGVRRSAFWHLGRRDHSEKELREKISRKTDNQQWIETVISECLDNNYLNDARFIENFIRSAQNRGFGLNRIKRDLQNKGISLNELADIFENSIHDYVNCAVRLLSDKYKQRLANQHLKQKAMAFLQGKGHDFNDIFSAIEIHNEAFPEEECVDINEAVRLLSRKFKTEIIERKQHDKAMRFLVSRGYTFSDTQDAVKEFNKQMHEAEQ